MTNKYLAPFTLALLVGLMIALTAPAASAQTTSEKIAVANPAHIFQELQETKDLKSAIDAKRAALEKEDFARRQKIKDLQGKRDGLKTDSAAYVTANNELLQATVEFEVWARTQQASVQAEQKLEMMNLFVKITNATAEVAKAKGIDLVIAASTPDFPENLDQLTVDQLRALINARNVLYNAPQVDISNDVIAAMDAKYKSGK